MTFDSNEEKYFYWYMSELKKAGFVEDIIPQHPVITLSNGVSHEVYKQLKTKTKFLEKKLFHEHIYTPDFTIVWTKEALGIFAAPVSEVKEKDIPFYMSFSSLTKDKGAFVSIFEIKPPFDHHNMTRAFTINQKWIYDKHGIYVNLIKPINLFSKTFTPIRYLWTNESQKRRKIHHKVFTLKEYLCQRKKILSLPIR